MIPQNKKVAFVVSHPAHLLTVAGMVIRFRPHILTLTKTDTGGGAIQGDLIRSAMRLMGLEQSLSSLDLDEDESYRNLLAGNFEPFLAWPDLIHDWLEEVKPDVVFGDGFELSNIQHDIGSLVLQAAVNRCRSTGLEMDHYEIPLLNRDEDEDADLRFGHFPGNSHEEFRLNDQEISLKKQVVEWAGGLDPQVEMLSPRFPSPDTEVFRKVPADRDYTLPPPGLFRFYDLYGALRVEMGVYEESIQFDRHFVPLARKLCGN